MSMNKWAIFAGGVLFGTAGIRLLLSKDARKAYTHVTAAALRAQDCVMDTASLLREGAEDIYEDAKQLNAARAAAEGAAVIEDTV
ncbi:MAG: DUF6110 family protein [Oscillospiraceae bacterium]|nr:DUF6110 family protein [Oscillospiraceae bacterium]